ncbi:MAG: fimbrillin family protein [Muribaculaceae bacterium]|nr:fimbrillin family protein [Muribaculaceae bacterium]
MNKLILPYIFILTSILCACQDIEDFPTSAGKVNADIISLNITVADNTNFGDSFTRVQDDGMLTYFDPGDAVGVIILDRNNNFIVNNAKFSLDENHQWTFQGEAKDTPYYNSEMQTYIVYFPYDESVTDAECTSADTLLKLPAFELQEDQTSKYAYRRSDVMAWESSEGPFKEINAQMRHLRNCISLDINVRWTLLTENPRHFHYDQSDKEYNEEEYNEEEYNEEEEEDDNGMEIVTFKIPNEVAIFDQYGVQLKHYQADDGTFRYILPDEYEGEITYFYNYRESLFKGAFYIQAHETGKRYSKYEIANMGDYTYDKVIIGDFYCKNTMNNGFVLPCEATKYLDSEDHLCIGLVFFTDQNVRDGVEDIETGNILYNYNYSETGIREERCHGYVMALTDVNNDLNDLFEWELDEDYDVYHFGETRGGLSCNQQREDWGGYNNTQNILNACYENGWNYNWYPAAYAATLYGNLVSKTINVYNKKKMVWQPKTIIFHEYEGETELDYPNPYEWQKPLQAPENTTGWYLPALGQLNAIRQYQSLFEQRYEEIKKNLADTVPYKDHIGWFKYQYNHRGSPYYWSSTVSYTLLHKAYSCEYSIENWTLRDYKSTPSGVRAVLAY